jgi:hypothetical protein
MLLRAGEAIVLQAEARYWGADGPAFGTLYLTNQRLVFEQEAGGVLTGSSTRTFLDCGFDEIVNVGLSKPLLSEPVLLVELSRWSGQFRLADPQRWLEEVARLKAESKPQIPGGAPHIIERQVVKVRCRHCGALNIETDSQCFACNAPM